MLNFFINIIPKLPKLVTKPNFPQIEYIHITRLYFFFNLFFLFSIINCRFAYKILIIFRISITLFIGWIRGKEMFWLGALIVLASLSIFWIFYWHIIFVLTKESWSWSKREEREACTRLFIIIKWSCIFCWHSFLLLPCSFLILDDRLTNDILWIFWISLTFLWLGITFFIRFTRKGLFIFLVITSLVIALILFLIEKPHHKFLSFTIYNIMINKYNNSKQTIYHLYYDHK